MYKIEILKGDITKIEVDAVVNAANTSLLGGSGVDGAIHRAGGKIILEECLKIRDKQGGCKVGEAVITEGGNLNAKFVIHAVGPIWQGGNKGEEDLLYSAYTNSLLLAEKHQVQSIAFPNISTGAYRFPKVEAAKISIHAIKDHISKSNSLKSIIIICFEEESYEIYNAILK